MLAELSALLSEVTEEGARKNAYWAAIIDKNVLGKKTATTRRESAQRLTSLYGLDPSIPVFRLLRFFWGLDSSAHPLLAILCASAREPMLRISAIPILSTKEGDVVEKRMLVSLIQGSSNGSYSQTTLNTIVGNLLSSWTQSGHLSGKNVKVRCRPKGSVVATAYALVLSYFSGASGQGLFSTIWARILDQQIPDLVRYSQEASRRGLLAYRGIGNIVDIDFSPLLTKRERELARE